MTSHHDTTTRADLATLDPRNRRQAEAWNGEEGRAWARRHAGTQPSDLPLLVDLLDAAELRPTDDVLDVGCGTGTSTLFLGRLLPHGSVTGIDLSVPMVEQARAAAGRSGLGNVGFTVDDAQTHPFAPGTFDVVLSHFGMMFFADHRAAYRNLASALRPGGRLAFVVPQHLVDVEWFTVPYRAVAGALPAEDERAVSAMFTRADPAEVVDDLGRAGFVDVVVRPVDATLRFGADVDEAAASYLATGPIRALVERGVADEATAHARLRTALAPQVDERGVGLAGRHWLYAARTPAAG